MLNLQEIQVREWRDNPNIATQIAKEIEKASWKKSPFMPFLGKGENRGVRTYNVKTAQPYRPRIKAPLMGDGGVGNTDFVDNLDRLEIMSQTIYPQLVSNSLKSQVRQYDEMEEINFIAEASDSLSDWECRKRDRALFAALVNNITNCVVCDAGTKGFKDTSGDADVVTATKKIRKGDTMNVEAIVRAINMAKTGKDFKGKDIFPLRPVATTTYTNKGIAVESYQYVIMLSSEQIEQLRHDPQWIEQQKMNKRGLDNFVFNGLAGIINDCPVIDMGVWSQVVAGMPDSTISDGEFKKHLIGENTEKIVAPSAYAGAQDVCIGVLIGASALVIAGDSAPKLYIDDKQDLGRKVCVGIDRLYAIAKAKFDAHSPSPTLEPYSGKDYSVIGIFSSKE